MTGQIEINLNKKIYFVYMITNTINQKKYIGITTKKHSNTRFREHISHAKNLGAQALHKAIRKHGEENFEFIVIDTANSFEELRSKEQKYIELHQTYAPLKKGYNQTKGGDGVFGLKFTKESRQKMKLSASSRFSKTEEKEKQSQRQKNLWNKELKAEKSNKMKQFFENNPHVGAKHSEFMRKRTSDPVYRAKMKEDANKQFSTPEGRQKASKGQKKRFSKSSEREKVSKKSKVAYKNNPQLAAKMSLIKKDLYAKNPDLGKKHSKKMKEWYKHNPEFSREQAKKVADRAKKVNQLLQEITKLITRINSLITSPIAYPIRKRGALKINDLLNLKESLTQTLLSNIKST